MTNFNQSPFSSLFSFGGQNFNPGNTGVNLAQNPNSNFLPPQFGGPSNIGIGSNSLNFGAQGNNGNFGLPSLPGTNQQQGGGIMDFMFGNNETGTNGAAVPIAQSIAGLGSALLGMKQFGLAKDAFKESKRQFNLNFDAQRKIINGDLEDRQRARRSSAGSGRDFFKTPEQILKERGI